jgi:hypothetical protein
MEGKSKMGQKQLFLIVLGIIIVGVAVVYGLVLFNTNSEAFNRDALISECLNLGAMAQSYYKKEQALGGGGKSFSGWTIPSGFDTTVDGTFIGKVVTRSHIIIYGQPFRTTNYGWMVKALVEANSISIEIE